MSAPNLYTVAAAARTRQIRLGAMGHIVPLHHPLRLAEEIALTDQMVDGRLEVGLVPGILPDYFGPFGVDYQSRREVTMEFVGLLRRVYTDAEHFDFEGQFHQFKHVKLAVNPLQRPHPPLWLRPVTQRPSHSVPERASTPATSSCSPVKRLLPATARFLPSGSSRLAAPPNIAYSTVVYVDETDDKALQTSLQQAAAHTEVSFPSPPTTQNSRTIRTSRPRFSRHAGSPARRKSSGTWWILTIC